jgi:uncharacterized membrane protein YphA (DoxX/SURF4 family)
MNSFTMNSTLVALLLLAAALAFVAWAARLARDSADGGINSASRFFLIALRLVIGWHFLIEGMEKLHTPSWTSEAYLRESTGPLAPRFRALAGDRLIDKLTVGANGAFPRELEIEWRAYLDAFNGFYQLNDEYKKTAMMVFDQAKSKTLTWLTAARQPVQIAGAMPPPYTDELTVPERLERHEKLAAAVRAIEADLPKYGQELFTKCKTAKGDLNKWRADLKRDLDQQFQAFKKELREGVLVARLMDLTPAPYRGKLPPIEYRIQRAAPGASTIGLIASLKGQGPIVVAALVEPERFREFAGVIGRSKEKEWLSSVQSVHHEIRLRQTSDEQLKLDPAAEVIFANAFERKQGEQSGDEILPFTPQRPVGTWSLLDWSDAIVKYGLVIVGGCLLAGFFTRTACVAGAGFLLMFFLAMPPLPGWPENPRAEGHYLYINKNIIEMFALLALATMRTGRWAGLDGLLYSMWPGRWRAAPRSDNVK